MTSKSSQSENKDPKSRRPSVIALIVTAVIFAASTAVLAGLLVNILQRKQEAKNPYLRFVDVTDDTTDPAEWGKNWPREYDGYQRTVNPTRTKYGGGSPSETMLPPEKAEANPWLTRMFAGYAFAIDYRDRRGHAFMLTDQESTKRTKESKQPGSCLHCHASVVPLYRKTGAEISPRPRATNKFNWVLQQSQSWITGKPARACRNQVTTTLSLAWIAMTPRACNCA